MKTYLGPVSPIDIVAAADYTSGNFVIQGSLTGVWGASGLSGTLAALHTEGVFTLPKTTSEAWTSGQALFWNTGTSKFTTDNTKLPVNARAALAAGSSAATSAVLLGGGGAPRTVAGQATTVSASDTIVTGLTKLTSAIAVLDDNPGDDPEWANASIGDQAGSPAAGSFLLKTWKNTGGTDPTPVAATTFSKKVNWIASGY